MKPGGHGSFRGLTTPQTRSDGTNSLVFSDGSDIQVVGDTE